MSEVLRHTDTVLASSAAMLAGGSAFYTFRQVKALNEKIERVMVVVTRHEETLERMSKEIENCGDVVGTIKVRGEDEARKLSYVGKELRRWSSEVGNCLQSKCDTSVPGLVVDPPKRKSKSKRRHESSSEESSESSESEEDVRASLRQAKKSKRSNVFK